MVRGRGDGFPHFKKRGERKPPKGVFKKGNGTQNWSDER